MISFLLPSRWGFLFILFAVLSLNNLKQHKTRQVKNSFIPEKLVLRWTSNPGLVLSGDVIFPRHFCRSVWPGLLYFYLFLHCRVCLKKILYWEPCFLFLCAVSSTIVMLWGSKSLAVVINSINLNLRIWIPISNCCVSYVLNVCPLAVTPRPRVALHDRDEARAELTLYPACALYIKTISAGCWWSLFS